MLGINTRLVAFVSVLVLAMPAIADPSRNAPVFSDPVGVVHKQPCDRKAHEPTTKDGIPIKQPGCLSTPFPVSVSVDLTQRATSYGGIPPQRASTSVSTLLQQVNQSLLLSYLQDLTAFGPRVTESAAIQASGNYIFNTFDAMGLDVRFHDWSYQGRQGSNVEATLYGSDTTSDEIYIICSHYDSVPGSPGADDNGSGTAAVLAAAQVLSPYAFDHTIRFVTFSGEEQGLLGSYRYVGDAFAAGDNIMAALNADMIGFALNQVDEGLIQVFLNGSSSWLADYTTNINALYSTSIDLTILQAGLTSGSDHWYFWQYGYDALFYHEYNFNDYYHSSQDRVTHINLTYHTKVTRLLTATLAELAGFRGDPNIPQPPTLPIGEQGFTKDRYLSFVPDSNWANPVAYRVTRVGSTTPWYVSCTLQDAGVEGKFGELVPTAEFCAWTESVIHVRGCDIVPGNEYLVEATLDDAIFSAPLSIYTTAPQINVGRQFGDVVGALVGGAWTAPDGIVTVSDITAVVQKFQLDPSAPHLSRVDNDGKTPNGIVASNDILRAVVAFLSYDFGYDVTNCLSGTCVPSCP